MLTTRSRYETSFSEYWERQAMMQSPRLMGQEALDKVSRLNVGIVLLDIKMPEMSGIEVLQQITTNWPETCVVMVTAAGDAETAVEAMKAGASDYITKPFNRDDVVLKVQKAIEKRDLLWHLLKNLETPD